MKRTVAAALLAVVAIACGDRVAPSRPDAGVSDAGTVDAADMATDMGEAPSRIGEECDGPANCINGASCIGTVLGDFICMQQCEVPYSICPGGSVCTPVSDGSPSVCYIGGDVQETQPCTSNLQCAAGLLCFGSDPDFFCRGACEVGAAGGCLPGEYCLPLGTGAGICRDVIGADCQSDTDCSGGGLSCTTTIDAAWAAAFPGGYCTNACSGDSDCSFGSRCASIDGSDTSVCVKGCDHVSDCRFNTDYRCVSRSECPQEDDPDLCTSLTPAGSACLR